MLLIFVSIGASFGFGGPVHGQEPIEPDDISSDEKSAAIEVDSMSEVAVSANYAELQDGVEKVLVYRLSDCVTTEEKSASTDCYIRVAIESSSETDEQSVQRAMNGTLTCNWQINYGAMALAKMVMNASGTFHVTDFRAPLTWTSGNQGGTTNIFWGASWSELSGVSVNPSYGTRSGNSASAWAQAKLNASGEGISVIDRVLAQTLNVNTSTATCSYTGW